MKIKRSKKFTSFAYICITLILIISLSLTALADLLFIEAESGKVDGISIIDDGAAFGSKAIQTTELGQTIEYTFNLEKSGKYIVWARVFHEHNEDNSYFYSLDEDTYDGENLWIFDYYEESEYEVIPGGKYLRPEYNNAAAVNSTWYWIPLTYRDANADPVTRHNIKLFDLTEGAHTLLLQAREVGAKIDKIIITDDLDYAPHTIDGDPEAIYLAELAAIEAAAVAEAEALAAATVTAEAVEVPVQAAVEAPAPVVPQTGDNAFVYVLAFALLGALGVISLRRRREN